MDKRLVVSAGGFVLAVCCAGLSAQQLPKSGSISFHTGYQVKSDGFAVADKTMQGHGTAFGVTFNDKGSGPLHGGPATCFFTFFVVDGRGKNKGYCSFGDADGDRIFTDWYGNAFPDGNNDGVNEIAGGTGKYAGIQGRGPWKCRNAGVNGELHCNQRFDYQLQ
jgi:hypothetical protein